MAVLFWLIGGLAALLLLYWLIVLAEGAYFGPAAVRLLYQRGAAIYDGVRVKVVASDEALLLPLLRSALPAGPARVLDVATGTGRVPLLLAGQPWFVGTLAGIDQAPAMLARARAKLEAQGLAERVALELGQAGALPWPAASFDLVVSLEALEFFPRPRRALAEMARTLKPGGALIVSKYPDQWARALPLRGLTRRAMLGALRELGFESVEFRPWQPGHYELVIAWKAGC